MDSKILTQTEDSPQFKKLLKMKLEEMIEDTNVLFEKRQKAVNKEIELLRIDYQFQLKKINEFLDTPRFVLRADSPKKSPIQKKFSLNKNKEMKTKILDTQNLCGYLATNPSEVSTPKLSKNNNFKKDTRNFINSQNKSKFKILKDPNYLLKATETASASTSFYSNYNSGAMYKPSPKSKVASTSPLRSNHHNIFNSIHNFSGTKIQSKNIKNFEKSAPQFKKDKVLVKGIVENFQFQSVEEKKEEMDSSSLKSNNIKMKDQRRFSILDIEACSPTKNTKAEILLPETTHKNTVKVSKDLIEKRIAKCGSSKIKGLCILLYSDVLPLKTKLSLLSAYKVLSQIIPLPNLIKNHSILIQTRLLKIENNFNFENWKNINFNFRKYPTRTAQNALNFLKKEDEAQLINYSDQEILKSFFNLILLLTPGHKIYENISLDNIYTEILETCKVDSLSKLLIYLETLFLHVIYKNVYLDYSIKNGAIEMFQKIINTHPVLINTTEISKLNSTIGFISFSLQEIYEFLTIRDPNESFFIYCMRKSLKEYKHLQKEDELLEKVQYSFSSEN